ncbi:MAG: hypothetical protein WKF40_11945 [Thermoleophilaceae bacterium]
MGKLLTEVIASWPCMGATTCGRSCWTNVLACADGAPGPDAAAQLRSTQRCDWLSAGPA